MEIARRGTAALTICSSAFAGLGRAQAKALGYEAMPLAIVPHPFGLHSREALKGIAAACAEDIVRLLLESPPQ